MVGAPGSAVGPKVVEVPPGTMPRVLVEVVVGAGSGAGASNGAGVDVLDVDVVGEVVEVVGGAVVVGDVEVSVADVGVDVSVDVSVDVVAGADVVGLGAGVVSA